MSLKALELEIGSLGKKLSSSGSLLVIWLLPQRPPSSPCKCCYLERRYPAWPWETGLLIKKKKKGGRMRNHSFSPPSAEKTEVLKPWNNKRSVPEWMNLGLASSLYHQLHFSLICIWRNGESMLSRPGLDTLWIFFSLHIFLWDNLIFSFFLKFMFMWS